MFVKRVIHWISPPNKLETPENCMETSSQSGKDAEEEPTNWNQTTEYVDSDSTLEEHKKNGGTTFLEEEQLSNWNQITETEDYVDANTTPEDLKKIKGTTFLEEEAPTSCNQTTKTEEKVDVNSTPSDHRKNVGTTNLELKDGQRSYDQEVVAGGDGYNKHPRISKQSPLCSRIPENRSSSLNISKQTDNKRRRGKVVMFACATRSESRVEQRNRVEDFSPSMNCKTPKITSPSCKNSKEIFWRNVINNHGVKEEFLSENKRVVPMPPKMEGIPIKNLTKMNKNGFSHFDEIKKFSPGTNRAVRMSSKDGIIPSRMAILLRDAVEKYHHKELDPNIYGELLVLGSEDGTSRVSSRFVLRRRQNASGVKETSSATYIPPLPVRKHTVSFQVSASKSVVVEYVRDTTTDMFQMGRHEYPPIDIRVANTNNGRKGVSRFACRLIVQREGHPRKVRLYAAAFDASGNIFLGEEAVGSVRSGGDIDGFTTNGVHLLHPGGEWREVSVRGQLYPARAPGEATASRRPVQEEENLLQDGTLIDLCGVTLLWRTREGVLGAPDKDCLDKMDSLLKELAPQCQRRNGPLTGELHSCGDEERRVLVFSSCGHVVSMAVRLKDTMEGWSCPECRCIGPVACLRVGREPGFYADGDLLSHAFRPCGHVATLRTVRYWSAVPMPPHRNVPEKGVCPFCATKLNPINKYVALIYPSQ